MFLRSVGIGASLIALSAYSVSAQTTRVGSNTGTVQDSGTNNQATISNGAPSNDNNNAQIVFEGSDNRTSIDQLGVDNGATSNQASNTNLSRIRQTGNRNSATLLQGQGNRNSSDIDQHVDPAISVNSDRRASVEQRGASNSSTVQQLGSNNSVTVSQGRSDALSQNGVSTIIQTSSGNAATVTMIGEANGSSVTQERVDPAVTLHVAEVAISGSANSSSVRQAGLSLVGRVQQSGHQNVAQVQQLNGADGSSSTITQLLDFNSASARQIGGARNASTIRQTGLRNSATLLQEQGSRNSSNIDQSVDPAISINSDRQASVTQRGSDNSSTVQQLGSNSSATVVQGQATLLSQGTFSSIVQSGTGDVARVFLFEGSVEAPNRSTIVQERIEAAKTEHVSDVSIRGIGNESSVRQTGVRHFAEVSILRGGVGTDASTMQRRGNSSDVTQRGSLKGHVARLSIGGTGATQGIGTTTSVNQSGDHATISNAATVWQRGEFTFLTIGQRIRGSQDDGGAFADVAQSGRQNQINLQQIGRHSATVTQGLGSLSSISLTQYDTGGGPRAGIGDAGTRAFSPNHVYRGNNSFVAAQYGDRNSVTAWQEGADNNVTVWQKVGSSNNGIGINQGRRFEFNQFSYGSSIAGTQSGHFNSANFTQYGEGLSATVEQLGTGSAELPNIAQIRQITARSVAKIYQTVNVGPSAAGDPSNGEVGDPGYFAGGARNVFADIRQSAADSTASIEQRGRGQYATIEQFGSRNEASILQDIAATNATAAIYQEGTGNSYSITQTRAGQYTSVSQRGDNNVVTTVVQRPGR
jgi:hypothetical protein